MTCSSWNQWLRAVTSDPETAELHAETAGPDSNDRLQAYCLLDLMMMMVMMPASFVAVTSFSRRILSMK